MNKRLLAVSLLSLPFPVHGEGPGLRLFVDVGVAAIQGDVAPTKVETRPTDWSGSSEVRVVRGQGWQEPHASVEVGLRYGKFTVSGYHISSLSTSQDRGINGLSVRWSLVDKGL